jgi:hypothetical protein
MPATTPDPTARDLAQEANPDLFDPDQTWDDEPGADDLPGDDGPVEAGADPVVES